MVPVLNDQTKQRIEAVEDLILSEVNIKSIDYIGDDSDILVKKIKPNFRELGKKHGKKMKLISAAIGKFTQDDIKAVERDGKYQLEIEGESLELQATDFEISSQDIPGWLVASENGLTVALDITISEELKREGLARDFVNRIQNLRKDNGLEVQDKIEISYFTTDEFIVSALNTNGEYIKKETQALQVTASNDQGMGEALEMDDYQLRVSLKVIK